MQDNGWDRALKVTGGAVTQDSPARTCDQAPHYRYWSQGGNYQWMRRRQGELEILS